MPRQWMAVLLLLGGLVSCVTTTPEAPTPPGEEPAEQTSPTPPLPAATLEEPPAIDDLYLEATQAREFEFISGLEAGLPEPPAPPATRYEDGCSVFAYPLPQLGPQAGHELVVVLMNVRPGERLQLPHPRARISYMVGDPERPHVAASDGVVVVHRADEHLAGQFEVIFRDLGLAQVRGLFDSAVTPSAPGSAPVEDAAPGGR